ncbi:MAG TPA: porphobilinogen synthase [Terriglobia bacterium]|nr:porphobilinogen synthase [Terriglobia bacterium]
MRRLRQNGAFRRLVRETTLGVDDLLQPFFVVPGHGIKEEISSIPGNYHLSIDCLVEEVKKAQALGLSAILLFGVPDESEKNYEASGAYSSHGIVQEAVRALKSNVPDILVTTDVCLCEYTPHSHCGVMRDGYLVNDENLELLAKTTISHAEAGADMVAPAAMLDGQIGVMRQALDSNDFQNVAIMAYSAKFASKLYEPFFKEGTQSALASGNKKTHQMPFYNSDEAMREIALDIEEGADIVMVKPALFYLDIVYRAKKEFQMPMAVYNVSGEYAMIDAAARMGRLDKDKIMFEALACMKRAGADVIITYAAMKVAESLRGKQVSVEEEAIPDPAMVAGGV